MPNIRLKGSRGEPVLYNGVDKIIVPGESDGETVEYSSGGLDVNGEVLQYPVANNTSVSRGDFVEFIEKVPDFVLNGSIVDVFSFPDDAFALVYTRSNNAYVQMIQVANNEMNYGGEVSVGGCSNGCGSCILGEYLVVFRVGSDRCYCNTYVMNGDLSIEQHSNHDAYAGHTIKKGEF